MTFNNPEYLFFLLVLIPVVFWYIKEMHHSDASLQISSHRNLQMKQKTLKIKLLHVPFVLRCLAITMVVIALARPQASNSWRTESTEGIDIMLTLDISGTMMAEDLKPNRLEASKALLTCLVLNPQPS